MEAPRRKWLSEPEAAKYIGMSVSWLSKSRLPGAEDTPPFYHVGRRVLYNVDELDSWLAAHRRRANTPEPAATFAGAGVS